MKYLIGILTIITFFITEFTVAQVGYQKDSLQIKVYAKIDYVNSRVVNIKVSKVFCDYCSQFQKEKIAQEAYRRAYLVRNDKDVNLINGNYKHAMYIRVSKKDFAKLKRYNDKEKDTTIIEKIID